MSRIETKDVKMVNLSIKKYPKKGYDYIKPIIVKYVRKFFAWAHRGLTWLENKALEKIDKLGKKADEYLAKRIEVIEEVIEDIIE